MACRSAISLARAVAVVVCAVSASVGLSAEGTRAPKSPPGLPSYHLSDGFGKGRTSLFGLTAEGHKFVYCFDRSGSMGGSGRTALEAVKKELLASLEPLESTHQFQIIFYNERPVIFNPSGMAGRLAFANDQNKQRAAQFIQRIVADGGTRHEEALRLAIKMRPDVIFFLTDADEPRLERGELDAIQRLAAGIIIHAIEFGSGPKPPEKSFLAQLAEENGGQYTYIDLGRRKPNP